jgi:hypothetical protein
MHPLVYSLYYCIQNLWNISFVVFLSLWYFRASVANSSAAVALARANQLVAEIEAAAHDNNNDEDNDGTDPTVQQIGRHSQQQPKKRERNILTREGTK